MFWFSSIAQNPEGEVVISEEKLQQLAYKLYELKVKRNTSPQAEVKSDVFQRFRIDSSSTITRQSFEVRIDSSSSYTRYKEVQLDSLIEVYSRLNETQKNVLTQQIEFYEERLIAEQLILEKLDTIDHRLKKYPEVDTSEEEISEEEVEEINMLDSISRNSTDLNRLLALVLANQAANQERFSSVDKKLDSLLTLNSKETPQKSDSLMPPKRTDSLSTLEKSMEGLKSQVLILQAKIDAAAQEDTVTRTETKLVEVPVKGDTQYIDVDEEAYQNRKAKYGQFFETVYFENNSIEISEEYEALIQELIDLIEEEDKIDVSIAGYASNTGSEAYNKELSLKRALALKKQLMSEGISPQRILTDYKGIDYEAETQAEARRLDVQFVVRK